MKKIFVYTVILVLMCSFFLTYAQTKTNETPKELQGIWILKSNRTSDKLELGFVPTESNLIKIITSDGKFSNLTGKGPTAYIITEGLFKIESDTIYTESIELSIHSNLTGINNAFHFRIENDNKLYLKWLDPNNGQSNSVAIWTEELWEKVEMPLSN